MKGCFLPLTIMYPPCVPKLDPAWLKQKPITMRVISKRGKSPKWNLKKLATTKSTELRGVLLPEVAPSSSSTMMARFVSSTAAGSSAAGCDCG